MSEIHVHNGGPDAIVFTRDGRIIGPHRTLPARASDPVTARLLACRRLTYCQLPESAYDPEPAPDDQADTEEVLAEPAGNASTEEWQDYAISQGLDPAEVGEMKRDEIRELFTDSTPTGAETNESEKET